LSNEMQNSPVGMRSHKLGHGVSKCRIGVNMEYRIRVFAVVHASFGENHRYEVDAGGLEKRESSGFCEELCMLAIWATIVVASHNLLGHRHGKCFPPHYSGCRAQVTKKCPRYS
jgi:hypothetical protein